MPLEYAVLIALYRAEAPKIKLASTYDQTRCCAWGPGQEKKS